MEDASNQPYMGDLAKTDTIYKLIQTPKEQRNELWIDMFLENLAGASFRCGDPQVITGPDGYPYFQLFLPEPGVEFQCFVIDHMTDAFLLENGLGVVVNPSGAGADWVLTYGDILNLKLNQTFYTADGHSFSTQKESEVLQEEEQVMVAQPSEQILPGYTRAILREYLKANGIENPKVVLMMKNRDGKVSQDIVFNITLDNFKTDQDHQGFMGSLQWFLPQHYSYAGMDEQVLKGAFIDL
jgi:hypothetical protein